MKILVDARSLVDPSPGGIPRVSRELLPALFAASQEHQFSLITTGQKKPSLPLSLPPHVTHQHVHLPNKCWSLGCATFLWTLDQWSTAEPDVLFFPNLGFIGHPSKPYAVLVHDISFLIEPRWFGMRRSLWHRAVRARSFLKHAHHLFAVSEKTKQDLIRLLNIKAETVTTLPFGWSMRPTAPPLPPILEGRPFFLAFGANNPRKNTATATAAFERLKEKRPDEKLALVIVGGSPAPKPPLSPLSGGSLNALPDKGGMGRVSGDPIIFLNSPSDAALQSLFKHATAFLYPSWYEGFGIPLHEAAQFNTPCLAADAGALPETAPKGTLFLPAYKPHLWATAMEQCLDTRDLLKTTSTLPDWNVAAECIKNRLVEMNP
ncbi:MAG: glycosyltransferase family 1 protein [bacterium]|nr:glycosyltransferase family 1 protein [bacterium]